MYMFRITIVQGPSETCLGVLTVRLATTRRTVKCSVVFFTFLGLCTEK